MFKHAVLVLILAAALASCVTNREAVGGVTPVLVWETRGFVAPESAVFDSINNLFYVSSMGSWGEGATPGDGFISRVSAEGELLELRWVTGATCLCRRHSKHDHDAAAWRCRSRVRRQQTSARHSDGVRRYRAGLSLGAVTLCASMHQQSSR